MKSGFALLFAVLASSLLIAIGVSIFNTSLKELQIATSERDSQTAYYAADSAEECALYWDIKVGSFPECLNTSCQPNTSDVSTSTTNTISCNGNLAPLSFSGPGGNYTFTYSTSTFFGYSTGFGGISPEAGITITKQYFYNGGNSYVETTVNALGHNTGIIGRRVERGISQSHNN